MREDMNDMSNVFAVVVTYNRRALLSECLAALQSQTQPLARIVVIDNASTDGTQAWLEHTIKLGSSNVFYVRMHDNQGGAGGFAEGIRQAFLQEAQWVWIMDDDAAPKPDALEQLLAIVGNSGDIYGSLAMNGEDTAWATTLLDSGGLVVNRVAEVPVRARVQSLPFLGFMVHRELVDTIGLPDPGYFIAADDVEYCLRAEQVGAQIFIAGNSHIHHPKSERYLFKLPNRNLICLRLPPWKRYYDTRNRLLIAKKYYGSRLLTQTIPGSFVRLFAALLNEPHKGMQLWAFIAGFIDGILGCKGRRHTLWKIPV